MIAVANPGWRVAIRTGDTVNYYPIVLWHDEEGPFPLIDGTVQSMEGAPHYVLAPGQNVEWKDGAWRRVEAPR